MVETNLIIKVLTDPDLDQNNMAMMMNPLGLRSVI